MDDGLPSVEITKRFLVLCEQYGSHKTVVRLIADGRRAGIPGLPASDDWTSWNAGEMERAVDYLHGRRASPI